MSSAGPSALPPDFLLDKPYALIESWLELGLCRELAADLKEIEKAGAFSAARVGRDQHKARALDQRRDLNHWIDPQRNQAWRTFHDALEKLRSLLREQLRLPLADIEVQASVYAPGAFYRRHVDEFKEQNLGALRSRRLLSAVFYLNEGWSNDEGGELLLWQGERCLERVAPLENRLVLFKSDLAHEVLAPLCRPRYSVAVWFRSLS